VLKMQRLVQLWVHIMSLMLFIYQIIRECFKKYLKDEIWLQWFVISDWWE
jgi:hypothetical protein